MRPLTHLAPAWAAALREVHPRNAAGHCRPAALQVHSPAPTSHTPAPPLQKLEALQSRLQEWLGRQGAAALALAAPAPGGAASSPAGAAQWDAARRLGIPARFQDLPQQLEPRLFLDAVLPRAAALAETCPDTGVRVAASELLHAAVLFIVGANARRPRAQGARRPRAAELALSWR
jgi:hypothetical protein